MITIYIYSECYHRAQNRKPIKVLAGGKPLNEINSLDGEGWTWKPLKKGGVLTIRHETSKQIKVLK